MLQFCIRLKFRFKLILFVFTILGNSTLIGQEAHELKYLICQELELECDLNTSEIIFIVTDIDCSKCINVIGEKSKNKNYSYRGLFYSKNKLAFKKRISNIAPNVNWKEISNFDIIDLLYKNKSGPLRFVLHNGVLSLDPYWMSR